MWSNNYSLRITVYYTPLNLTKFIIINTDRFLLISAFQLLVFNGIHNANIYIVVDRLTLC